MPLSSSSKENISIKKLVGKAHTSNALEAFNESKSTGITISASSVIANAIPSTPTSTNLYDITSSVVEYVRLVATPLNESIVDGKYHAFKLSLPSDYASEGNSSNESAGSAPFINSQDLFASNGSLQIIPPSFADAYEAKVYYGGDGTKGSGTRIPLLDNRSWYLDYFNGILFQEVPPDNEAQNPEYVEAYIYIGQMASERFTEGGGGGGGASQLNDLTDVTIGNVALAQNQILVYTANNVFENQTFSSTQLSDTTDLIRTTSSIASLADVHNIDDIADGNVLAWNSDENRFEFTAPAVTYTDEEARNAAGSALAGGTHTGIAFVNNDAGNTIDATVSLGGFSIGDLSDIDLSGGTSDGKILKWSTDKFVLADDVDTNTQLSDEEVQDIVGAMVSGNTETDLTVVYNDDSGKLDFSVNNTIARIDSPTFTGTPSAPTAAIDTNTTQIASTAFVQAQINSDITALNLGTASQNDTGDFLAAGSSIDTLSDVDISTNVPQNGQVLKWDGSNFVPSIDTGKTEEEIEDIVGGMVSGNTETDITVEYDDNNGKLNFTVNNTIARLDDPDFTGTPTAPTAAVDTNTTQIASTAFVQAQINSDITALNLGTASQSDTGDFLAANASIDNLSNVDISTNAPQDGQVLKWDGSNFVPANDIDTNTQLSDEQVQDIIGAMVSGNTETDITVEYNDDNGKLNFSVDNTIARLNDPDFTGTPTAPTAAITTNTTQIATTSFVHSLVDSDIAALNLAATYQPLDAGLTSISGLTTESDKLIYTTDSDTYATSTLTAFARTLLDDATAADVRVTLGLGTASVKDQDFFLLNGAGINDLSDVLLSSPDNAHILVYDNDAGENDDKWKNVSLTGDITINNLGVSTIGTNKVTNDKLLNSTITITDGTISDSLPLGQTLTINSVANETTVSVTADAGDGADGVEITIGLPNDVIIGQDLTVSRNLVVTGDFTVNGSSSTISTTNLDVEDSIISLNNGIIGNDPDNNPVANPATRDIGFFFDRGSLNPTLIFWDEADDVFKLGSHSGGITSTSSDLGDAENGFSYEYLKVATVKDVDGNIDTTSSDNTVATTEWVDTKIGSEITDLNLGTAAQSDTGDFIASGSGIDALSDVDTTGKAEGKILQFNADGNLVAADASTNFNATTASLWAEASTTNDNGDADLYPHGIIDGTLDTGMFAINLSAGSMNFANPDITLHDILEELSSMNAYTPSTRNSSDILDAFFEIYTDEGTGEECIRPK